jgi:hypothetical protein
MSKEINVRKSTGIVIAALAALAAPSASQATLVPRVVYAEEFGWHT